MGVCSTLGVLGLRRRIAMSMKRVQASEERRQQLSAVATGRHKTCAVRSHTLQVTAQLLLPPILLLALHQTTELSVQQASKGACGHAPPDMGRRSLSLPSCGAGVRGGGPQQAHLPAADRTAAAAGEEAARRPVPAAGGCARLPRRHLGHHKRPMARAGLGRQAGESPPLASFTFALVKHYLCSICPCRGRRACTVFSPCLHGLATHQRCTLIPCGRPSAADQERGAV